MVPVRKMLAILALSFLPLTASPVPASAYQIDCAILLCLAGGFPPSAPCTAARAEMIRRITPWPIEPPLQIWRCPMRAGFFLPNSPFADEPIPVASTAPPMPLPILNLGNRGAAHKILQVYDSSIESYLAVFANAKRVSAQGVAFLLHPTSQERMFGLKTIWRGSMRVQISDPARTIIDMIATPNAGGGIDHVADCLAAYQKTATYDADLLVRYAAQFGNGAVFKRLGFLAETDLHDAKLAADCHAQLTQGYAQLDPALPSKQLQTAWRLWVPPQWKLRAS